MNSSTPCRFRSCHVVRPNLPGVLAFPAGPSQPTCRSRSTVTQTSHRHHITSISPSSVGTAAAAKPGRPNSRNGTTKWPKLQNLPGQCAAETAATKSGRFNHPPTIAPAKRADGQRVPKLSVAELAKSFGRAGKSPKVSAISATAQWLDRRQEPASELGEVEKIAD